MTLGFINNHPTSRKWKATGIVHAIDFKFLIIFLKHYCHLLFINLDSQLTWEVPTWCHHHSWSHVATPLCTLPCHQEMPPIFDHQYEWGYGSNLRNEAESHHSLLLLNQKTIREESEILSRYAAASIHTPNDVRLVNDIVFMHSIYIPAVEAHRKAQGLPRALLITDGHSSWYSAFPLLFSRHITLTFPCSPPIPLKLLKHIAAWPVWGVGKKYYWII